MLEEVRPLETVEEVLGWHYQPLSSREATSSSLGGATNSSLGGATNSSLGGATNSSRGGVGKPRKYLSGEKFVEAGNRSWEWLVKQPLASEEGRPPHYNRKKGKQPARVKGQPLAKEGRPRTLVCHDMMGGYLQDRFVDGANQDGYYFHHWSCIDIFIYFSHKFITIPPPGWIAAAKLHGVEILGTIITEFREGADIINSILSDKNTLDKFVGKCVDIARCHGFDGWLLNIENPVAQEQIPRLLELVEKLTKGMKSIDPNSTVIWYDSVTIEGKLEWQDELNELNQPFMDLCDGIFLNYTWKCRDNSDPPKDSLINSLLTLEDGSRRTDIFVGVDVFGRGCLGGGGFSCNLALERIRAAGLSVAIFAPGWTYEIPHRELPDPHSKFQEREHLFWFLLQKHLFYRAVEIGLSDLDHALLFSTGFSSGRGKSPAWWNLKSMQIQPSLLLHPCIRSSQGVQEQGVEWAPASSRGCSLPPYTCHVSDDKGFTQCQSVCISVSVPNTTVPLLLTNLNPQGSRLLFLLRINCQEDPQLTLVLGNNNGSEVTVRPLREDEEQEERLLNLVEAADAGTGGKEAENKDKWRMKGFLLEDCSDTVEKIGVRVRGEIEQFYLGQLSIFNYKTE